MALPFLPLDLQALSQRVVWRSQGKDTWPAMLGRLPSRLPARMWGRTSEKQVNGTVLGVLGHRCCHQGWGPSSPDLVTCFPSMWALLVWGHTFPLVLSLSSSFKGKQMAAEGQRKVLL